MNSRRSILVVLIVVAAIIVVSVAALQPTPSNYDFQIQVAYQGHWQVSWTSYRGGPPAVIGIGDYSGTGNASRLVSVQVPSNFGAYFCAQANKLDNSSGALTLSLYDGDGATRLEMNSTSAPSGTTMVCAGLYP